METLNCKIRKALLQDSDELIKLADELIHLDDRLNRAVIVKEVLQDPHCRIYVAEVDNAIAGFIDVRIFPDFVEGAPVAIIMNLIVKKTCRRRGVGTKLTEKAMAEAEKQNAAEIHVWTEFGNKQAISFYTKQGFRKRALLLEKETQLRHKSS